MQAAEQITKALGQRKPETALVLGSGLGAIADNLDDAVHVPFGELTGFPKSAVSGHQGALIAGQFSGKDLIILSGRVHYYEDGNAAAMRPAIGALSQIGIRQLILTNSAGSLREDLPPGSIMQIVDHINFAGTNPLIGEASDRRFVGLTNAYSPDLIARFGEIAEENDIALAKGVYMWFSGPSFETPAEIKAAKILGADAVGMSTVPEVILARFYDMEVAAFSTITNLAAGMTGAELSHDETKQMAPLGGKRLARLLGAFMEGG